jgi:hypothetical protein
MAAQGAAQPEKGEWLPCAIAKRDLESFELEGLIPS